MNDTATLSMREQTANRLQDVKCQIDKSAEIGGRDPADVRLIAVSKAQPDERLEAALAAGIRCFGENRVQEAQQHWAQRRSDYPDLDLHLIGPLQTNKVKVAVQLFDAIHTVDRPKLAARLTDAFSASGRQLPCYIEVNIGEEGQKAGVLPADVDEFIESCRRTYALPIVTIGVASFLLFREHRFTVGSKQREAAAAILLHARKRDAERRDRYFCSGSFRGTGRSV